MDRFNEYVRDSFSEFGDIVIKSMMGRYLVYFNGKLIGGICNFTNKSNHKSWVQSGTAL